MKKQEIIVQKKKISFFTKKDSEYISLTDIARYRDKSRSDYVLQNWLRNYSTIEFLGLWEKINNPSFKSIEFDGFKKLAGSNSFSLTPKKWIKDTDAIGIISKKGRYGGGTFAHKDIAFEFVSWISPEFKLYLIKEFQRLKSNEKSQLQQDWDAKRFLVRANYRVHTDAVKKNLIPKEVSKKQANSIYASEADILNMAMFGVTAREWRKNNPKKEGNIRDNADIMQLVCLAGLESLNAEFIREDIQQVQRLEKLNKIAIIQMKSLVGVKGLKESNSTPLEIK
ncbi:MAG: KilA-N domain-containing protein [Candidatus Pacebacteria bacterium]|nr:KilA-N domain-containing protein [Candidatus Paceibacterota bacterium]